MYRRLFTYGVERSLGTSSKSWLFPSAAWALFKFVRSQTGRREMIDLSNTKPGDKILIEHLTITHGEQMKQMKRASKHQKKRDKENKAAARAERRAKRSYERATRVRRRDRRRSSV